MRIGYEIQHLDPSRGGAEKYVGGMVQLLLAEGHEVHLLIQDQTYHLEGAIVHRVRPFAPTSLRAIASRFNFDVFVGADKALGMNVFQPHRGTIRGNLRQELLRIQNPAIRNTVTLLNRVNPKYARSKSLERLQYGQPERATHFIAVSAMVENEMREEYAVQQERMHRIHNGVDCSIFSPQECQRIREDSRRQFGISADTVCFAVVANDFRRKGVREFIQAIALLHKRSQKICGLVVGRGNPESYCNLAVSLGCHRAVAFVGPRDNILGIYAAADVFVLPTWYDPCSLSILEAWACRVPAITTRFNGAGELMSDGHEGFLIDAPSEIETLADRMETTLDPDLRTRMGHAARSLAECHSQERHFRKIMDVFKLAATNPTRS